MKTVRRKAPNFTSLQRMALRDSITVLVSSASLLARYIDRLPREKRDRQLAVLQAAAVDVQQGVELMLET